MALYPSHLPTEDYFNSNAEKKVYLSARDSEVISSSDKNYLFHSLRVQNANRKLTGEVDFVYLDKEFIIFLEVKGSEVQYDSARNDWYTLGGSKKQDPFEQVCKYLFHIRDDHFPKRFKGEYYDEKLKFGYGLMFPESGKPYGFEKYNRDYKGYTIEYTPEIIYLKEDHDRRHNFDLYLNRLKKYWRNYPKYRNGYNGIGPKDLESIKNFFRTDLIFKVPISKHLTEDREKTQFYTEKQMETLETVNKNSDFGIIVNGGPGTGKTVLALEQAFRKTIEGNKVLFVCYNKCLAEYLEKKFSQAFPEIEDEMITITTLHSLLLGRLRAENFSVDVSESDRFWEKQLPNYFYEVFNNYSFENNFDYLIVDEGQDIFRENYLNCLELLLKEGWESQNWLIFVDKEYQTIYEEFDQNYFETFKSVYKGFELYLNENCRNTPEIIKKAHVHTGLEEIYCLKPNRFKPELKFYQDFNELYNMIKKIVKELKEDDVDKNSITILTNNNFIKRLSEDNPDLFHDLKANGCTFPKGKIVLSTPHSYKGLENDFIIYTGNTNFSPRDRRQLVEFYVSYTRAKTQLYLLFPESIEEQVKQIADQTIKSDLSKRLKQ